MRFGESLGSIAIPQWKECYLNYEILKIFVSIIKEMVEALEECRDVIQSLDSEDFLFNMNFQQLKFVPEVLTQLRKIQKSLEAELVRCNKDFYETYQQQLSIAELFYQMKVMQIQDRYLAFIHVSDQQFTQEEKLLYLTYIQYSYIEIIYLQEMREVNLEAERKILKKHKKYSKNIVITPEPQHQKMKRLTYIQQGYVQKIEDVYVKKNHLMPSKQAREFLRLAAHEEHTNQLDFFLLGLGVGASIIVLTTLIFIIKTYDLTVENNSQFSRDFPTWRGPAFFILYIWVLGFNLYNFERYKISHRLIFNFQDHHYSTSAEIFKLAGLFTSFFLLSFVFYMLLITGIIKSQTSIKSQHLVSFVWLALIAYTFMPLPIFNHRGRLYALKLIFRSLLSPITGVDFTIIWMTDQWISLATPLRDTAYTVCYYTRLDFGNLADNPCRKNTTFEVVLLVIVIAFSYRILQCARLGYSQGHYWTSPHMINTLKYAVSLSSAIVSNLYSQGYTQLLWLWIALSITSTLYSYLWDLKMDWKLLQSNSRNYLLRKYLTFQPKGLYYTIIVSNFLMRLGWMLTISPDIALIFGNSNLLTFVTGSVEIIRRGIWNLLRVEREHLNNCVEFKAIPDMKEIQRKLKFQQHHKNSAQYLKEYMKDKDIVKKSYIELIQRKIDQRDENQKDFDQTYKKQAVKKVKKVKKRIQELIKMLKHCK